MTTGGGLFRYCKRFCDDPLARCQACDGICIRTIGGHVSLVRHLTLVQSLDDLVGLQQACDNEDEPLILVLPLMRSSHARPPRSTGGYMVDPFERKTRRLITVMGEVLVDCSPFVNVSSCVCFPF